jgi:8-oxo-dGTP pyrophosphatase MutT (NUDIX family)/GNAT superfamily N-acetyltransferase
VSVNDDLRAAVAARRPVDARERDSIRRFVDELDQLAQPFDEHASPTHVTASAIVTGDAGVVLHLHKRLGMWLQPGGHIDAGETPWQAAGREAVEETGLPIMAGQPVDHLVHVDVHPGPRGHTHLDLRYAFSSPAVQPSPPEGESQLVQWFTWADAIAMAEAGLEGVLRALQPGQPIIRRAAVSDATRCALLYLRSKAFAMPEVPEPHTEAQIVDWMAVHALATMDCWVAELDGVVVGQMMLAPGWLHHLYIDPSWIGRGLGDRFITLAGERQPDGLQLWAFQSNASGRRFYERHGFEAVEFTDGSANDERRPDVRYAS